MARNRKEWKEGEVIIPNYHIDNPTSYEAGLVFLVSATPRSASVATVRVGSRHVATAWAITHLVLLHHG